MLHPASQRGAFPAEMVPHCLHGPTAHTLASDFKNMLLILGIFFPTALRHLSPPWLETLCGRARHSFADPQYPLMDDHANIPAWLSVLNSSLLPVGSCSSYMLSRRWHGIKDGEGCFSSSDHNEPRAGGRDFLTAATKYFGF